MNVIIGLKKRKEKRCLFKLYEKASILQTNNIVHASLFTIFLVFNSDKNQLFVRSTSFSDIPKEI